MAREHHCPNCGPQACNASTSKIHTCGVCAAVWEEVLTDSPPAAPKPAPAPAAPPKPVAPAGPAPAAPAAPPKPAAPPAPAPPPAAKPAAPPPPAPAQPPAAGAPAPPKPAPSAKPAAAAPAPPAIRGEDRPEARTKRLADVVAAAKVPRCPVCKSDSLAAPSDYAEQGGRVVLLDSQTYRGHRWFADTGEVLPAAPPPKPAAAPASPPSKTAA